MKKINIGCGTDIKTGWVNLDSHKNNGADIVHDITKPFPFEDNTFDIVYSRHVIEDFCDPLSILDEFIRITKIGGIIKLIVPSETTGWNNIYHKKAYSPDAFVAYINEASYPKDRPLEMVSIKYNPRRLPSIFGHIYYLTAKLIFSIIPLSIIQNSFIKYYYPNTEIICVYKKKE